MVIKPCLSSRSASTTLLPGVPRSLPARLEPGSAEETCMYSYELAVRTFHHYLHIIYQTVDNVKSLRNGRP